jgi:hypothetical protein
MKFFVLYTILLVSLLLASCVYDRSARAQSEQEPVFSMQAKNSDDQITLQYQENTTLIEIKSPSGIGSAAFKLESGDLPERIVARLHLKGLEEFRLIAGQITLAVSVPSREGLAAQNQRKISGASEQAIRSGDAFWSDIKIVSGSQQTPLENGYFEIILPKKFIQESGGSFEIHWIDFFR